MDGARAIGGIASAFNPMRVVHQFRAAEALAKGEWVTLAGGNRSMVDVQIMNGGEALEMTLEQHVIEMSERELVHAHPCVKGARLDMATGLEIAAMALITSALRTQELAWIGFDRAGQVTVRIGEGLEEKTVIDRLRTLKTLDDVHRLAARVRERLNGAIVNDDVAGVHAVPIYSEWVREASKEFIDDRALIIGPLHKVDADASEAELGDFVFWFLELAPLDVAADIKRMGKALDEILR